MSLRLLQIILPRARCGELTALLSDRFSDLPPDRVWWDDVGEELRFTSVLLPSDGVEPLTDVLHDRFEADPRFRLILMPVEATRPRLEVPEESGPAAPTESEGGKIQTLIGRISREELYEDIGSGVSHGRLFVAMVVISTVVAAAGLLRGSAAVIIGAMVIAPLLGPNMALALATTLGDRALMKKALRANGLGVAIALAMSIAMGMVVEVDPSMPELVARTRVDLTDLALALASGTAGALAFTAGVPATLVGVMVAVALLPPVAAAGIYFGAGQWVRAVDAASLFAVNVVCVNLAATATFLVQGVRPDTWWEKARAKQATRRALAAWLTLLAMLALLLVFR